jgi:hypothetical protein
MKQGMYVIDTVATITMAHQALALAAKLKEGGAKEQLTNYANEALSVCSYYMRYPRVQAQKKHYDSVQKLLDLMTLHTITFDDDPIIELPNGAA